MQNGKLVRLRNGREGILIEDGAILAVPPMPASVTPHDRQQILEYVLRRQLGLAMVIAEAADAAHRRMLDQMMTATPHKNARGYGMAA